MEPWLIVPPPAPMHDYPLFYALGFVASALVAVLGARRRGWDPAATAVMVVGVAVGGVLASKLLVAAVVGGDVGLNAVRDTMFEKTWLGGLLGGVGVGLSLARVLRLRHATEVFAPVIPVALIFGRLGCLFGGCCLGLPFDGAWAIAYAPGSDPYLAAVEAGVIEVGAAHGPRLHPAALYELGAAVLMLLALAATRERRRIDGWRLASVLVGYVAVRFGVEFVRVGSPTVLGLHPAQWVAFLLVPIAARVTDLPVARTAVSPTWAWIALLLPVCAAWPALTPLERLVLGAVLVASGVAVARAALGTARAVLVGGAVLAFAADGPEEQPPPPEPNPGPEGGVLGAMHDPYFWDGDVPTWEAHEGATLTPSFGLSSGAYVETCGGPRRYNGAASGFQLVAPLGRHSEIGGGIGAAYADDEGDQIVTAGPYVLAESRFVGGSVGIQAAWWERGAGDQDFAALPRASLRLGPRDLFWLEAAVGRGEVLTLPAGYVSLGLGVTLYKGHYGRWSHIRVGVADSGVFASPRFTFADGFEIEPYASFGDVDTWQTAITVRYHVPLSSRTRASDR